MVYVKHFDILGVDTAQIPCIELQGVPNTATVGAVGLLGMDMTSESHEVYICTEVNGAIYTWQPLKDGKDGSCVVKAEMDANGELIFTLSDGKVINAGRIQGEPGKDGADGRDGENGVSISGTEVNEDGELIVTFSNGTTTNAGKVVGRDGVSIVNIEMNADYEILLTLSNDTVINVGCIPAIEDLQAEVDKIIDGSTTVSRASYASSAGSASYATSANKATNATNATNADNAKNAENATNADNAKNAENAATATAIAPQLIATVEITSGTTGIVSLEAKSVYLFEVDTGARYVTTTLIYNGDGLACRAPFDYSCVVEYTMTNNFKFIKDSNGSTNTAVSGEMRIYKLGSIS